VTKTSFAIMCVPTLLCMWWSMVQ